MEKYNFSGKTKDEALNDALNELKVEEKDIFIKEIESKSGLFKSKKVEIEVIKKDDVINLIKEKLSEIIKMMGLEVNFEVKNREDNTTITVFSNNNNILIGKQGRTIDALSTIIKQYVFNELGFYFNFTLDIGEYKLKHQKNIERLAKQVAREVFKTKIEVKLDPMNSYERRIVHSILSENPKITTESIGEEPNRCVVIKPVEE